MDVRDTSQAQRSSVTSNAAPLETSRITVITTPMRPNVRSGLAYFSVRLQLLHTNHAQQSIMHRQGSLTCGTNHNTIFACNIDGHRIS